MSSEIPGTAPAEAETAEVAVAEAAHAAAVADAAVADAAETAAAVAEPAETVKTSTAAEMGIPYLGAIREAVAIREAQTLQRSLYEYAPNSNPAQDYKAVLQQILGG